MLALAILLGAADQPAPGQGQMLDGLSRFAEGAYAEALQDWIAAAAQGDADGALYAGVLYDTGQGIRQNPAQALFWYRRAAALGSATGAFNVGVMYDAGIGMPPQPAEAATWYATAAGKGYARADYNLALLYSAGIGVKRDPARAQHLFAAAARLGLSAARTHLVASGAPAPQVGPARTDIAMQDFAQAQAALLGRSPTRVAQAVTLFRRAAEQGDALAQYDLGYCYENGIGVGRDRLQAYEWYSRAATGAPTPQLRMIAAAGRDSIKASLPSTPPIAIRPGPALAPATPGLRGAPSHPAAPGK